nr:DUF2112 family protein [uncultured Methanobrevibacter sp.]
MKVAVIPDGAMIVVPLIEKNGHEYISPTNFSKYNNMDVCNGEIDETQAPYTLNRNNILQSSPYFSNELPSGIKGRLTLFSRVLELADAFIILGKRPKNYKKMYNMLNELILFGGCGCANEHKIVISLVKNKNVPILELAYPTTRNELINVINRTNDFLRNLDNIDGIINDDNLDVDLERSESKLDYDIFKEIFR